MRLAQRRLIRRLEQCLPRPKCAHGMAMVSALEGDTEAGRELRRVLDDCQNCGPGSDMLVVWFKRWEGSGIKEPTTKEVARVVPEGMDWPGFVIESGKKEGEWFN